MHVFFGVYIYNIHLSHPPDPHLCQPLCRNALKVLDSGWLDRANPATDAVAASEGEVAPVPGWVGLGLGLGSFPFGWSVRKKEGFLLRLLM